MKIKPFYKKAARIDDLGDHLDRDMLTAVKNLTPTEIKKLLSGFVPLDFVAVIQKYNTKNFNEAFRDIVARQMYNEQHKKWLEEAGIDKEEAINNTYIHMLNNDPRKRGILSEILLDGSYSDQFQYAREDDPQLRAALKNSLAPLDSSNEIVVPHCPVDKSLSVKYPLWFIENQNGKIEFQSGLDPLGRCLNTEIIGEMSEQDFNNLKETQDKLTEQQRQALNSGKRTLEYINGIAVLRCTFVGSLPKLQPFIYFKTKQAIKQVVDAMRKQKGKTIPPDVWKRLKDLEQKQFSKTINITEQAELDRIKKYIAKKGKEFVGTEMSIDTQMAGTKGDEGRSLHEMIADDSRVDQTEANDAKIALEGELSADQLRVIKDVMLNISMGTILNNYGELYGISKKDPQYEQKINNLRENIKQSATVELQKMINKDKTTENVCRTCQNNLGKQSTTCFYADQMRGLLYSSYQASKTFEDFSNQINKIDPHSIEHYNKSNLQSIINKLFQGIEIDDDDDLLQGLHITELMQSQQRQSRSELTEQQFYQTIDKQLQDSQRRAYYGTDLTGLDVSPESQKLVDNLTKLLLDTLNVVFNKELDEELVAFILYHGEI